MLEEFVSVVLGVGAAVVCLIATGEGCCLSSSSKTMRLIPPRGPFGPFEGQKQEPQNRPCPDDDALHRPALGGSRRSVLETMHRLKLASGAAATTPVAAAAVHVKAQQQQQQKPEVLLSQRVCIRRVYCGGGGGEAGKTESEIKCAWLFVASDQQHLTELHIMWRTQSATTPGLDCPCFYTLRHLQLVYWRIPQPHQGPSRDLSSKWLQSRHRPREHNALLESFCKTRGTNAYRSYGVKESLLLVVLQQASKHANQKQ
ncbi:hypothetical protein Esti_006242 [Eimeria stiedai]